MLGKLQIYLYLFPPVYHLLKPLDLKMCSCTDRRCNLILVMFSLISHLGPVASHTFNLLCSIEFGLDNIFSVTELDCNTYLPKR